MVQTMKGNMKYIFMTSVLGILIGMILATYIYKSPQGRVIEGTIPCSSSVNMECENYQ